MASGCSLAEQRSSLMPHAGCEKYYQGWKKATSNHPAANELTIPAPKPAKRGSHSVCQTEAYVCSSYFKSSTTRWLDPTPPLPSNTSNIVGHHSKRWLSQQCFLVRLHSWPSTGTGEWMSVALSPGPSTCTWSPVGAAVQAETAPSWLLPGCTWPPRRCVTDVGQSVYSDTNTTETKQRCKKSSCTYYKSRQTLPWVSGDLFSPGKKTAIFCFKLLQNVCVDLTEVTPHLYSTRSSCILNYPPLVPLYNTFIFVYWPFSQLIAHLWKAYTVVSAWYGSLERYWK